uniref:Uncharacterized protein n=1 Tax=Alexandrium monilatum TaxID=311494 RepID=A0A7S4W9B1_9DINO
MANADPELQASEAPGPVGGDGAPGERPQHRPRQGSSSQTRFSPSRVLADLDQRTLQVGVAVFVCSLTGTLLAVSLWAVDPSACDLVQISTAHGSAATGMGTATTTTQTTTTGLLERCQSSRAPVGDAIEMRAGMAPPFRFERCALVGSSPILRGQGRGFEIDMHDTVIRVNRVPQQKYYEDYGQRTDILFAGPGWQSHEIFTRRGLRVETMGLAEFKKAELCPYWGGPACRFTAIVLTALPETYPLDKPGWRPNRTAFPFGVVGSITTDVAAGFAGFHTTKPPFYLGGVRKVPWPTNGFYSLITFAPICTTLELFGFGGNGTADGHGFDMSLHNLSYDHYLMDRIVGGQLVDSDWSGAALKEDQEARRQWMEQHIAQRSRRGCITRAHSPAPATDAPLPAQTAAGGLGPSVGKAGGS